MDIKRVTSILLGFPLVLVTLIIGNQYVVDVALVLIAILSMNEYLRAVSKKSNPVKWVRIFVLYRYCFYTYNSHSTY